ncbi:MAG: hypothetical protein ACFFCZ_30635 [Promethearchaeota archaeon]
MSTAVLASQELPIHNGAGAVPDPYLLREYRGGALESSGALLVMCLHVQVCPKMRERFFQVSFNNISSRNYMSA